MAKCWSLSTTIRNPERNAPFLRVLQEFEGEPFNSNTQANLFKRLIQTKNYMPMGLPKRIKDKYEDPEEFTHEELSEILSLASYENKSIDNIEDIYAMRGRTAVSNLNKMCAAVARDSHGPVRITPLGMEIISGTPDFSNIFLRYFLKWQLPNGVDRGFNDFNIIPFIATMHVVKQVNEIWSSMGNNPVGLSKTEFALFIPTLTNYTDINDTANQLIEFRCNCRKLNGEEQKNYIDTQFIEKVINVFSLQTDDDFEIEKKINTLYDYADSAIRYFRMTNLFYYRGNGRYIDLSPRRSVEIEKLLETFSGESLRFGDIEEYFDYMSNLNMPQLPWENIGDLQAALINLREEATHIQAKIESEFQGQSLHSFTFDTDISGDLTILNNHIKETREIINLLNVDYSILLERSLSNIDTYISEISKLSSRRRSISGQDPLNLEWNVAQSLMALDDAKEIIPHYNVGDDNLPTFTAPGNTADMECHYIDFSMICEVTLLNGRDQWYNEGQPVMRHLRDFESNNHNENNYCLFLAPSLHRDTVNTFWYSVKYDYEGARQKIIPLTLDQYTKILSIVKNKYFKHSIRVNQRTLKSLFDIVYSKVDEHNNSGDWILSIDNCIDTWEKSYLI